MSALLQHELTARQLQSFADQPSHALLLHGPRGCGKQALALQLAAKILKQDQTELSVYPYLHLIDAPSVSSDAIEAIRKLEHFLSLRVPVQGRINRVVLIIDAQTLSMQAQNALLKTVEEPPAGTLLLLTATSQADLLPTISSRLQAIAVLRPAKAQLESFFMEAGQTKAAIDQAYAISGGLPGLMTALLTDDDHPLKPATETARLLLQQSVFERLLQVDVLTKQKGLVADLLYILQQMAHARLQTTTGRQFERWQQIMTASYQASEALEGSAQPKLVLDTLMLKLN